MSNLPLIDAHGLARYYGHYCAVHDISLTLHPGEVLGLLGPNGAGKSTTLAMLSGHLAPSAGSIHINGEDLLENPRLAKRHLGYLPETPPLYRDLTVDEYLRYAARLRGIPHHNLGNALELAKVRTGLEDAGHALVGALSKGFQQRVGIAQAIIHQPAAIILDEPTVGLDPLQISEMRDLISELSEKHGIILSTHILGEVQATCHRVVIINRGQVVFEDTLEHLADRGPCTRLKAVFKNRPKPDELSTIPGVISVRPLNDRGYLIEHAADQNPAEIIVEQSVTRAWGLCELTPERTNLEQAFFNTIFAEPDPNEELMA